MTPELETVIGLEVHVQLGVATKLFSSANNAFGGEPNTRVSPIDLGLPGVLPSLNGAALRVAIRAALALEGTVNLRTKFDRKNYFYADLPKGYQISQYDQPLCIGGRVPLGDGRHARLTRVHLEEDAGKNIHTDQGSLIDLNRAGVALIEIVGQPDLHSPADAHAFLDSLKQILQYADVSECDMEKGSLRCDANVSLRPLGQQGFGTKVEIKNLNSFKMVQRALEYEERRQAAVLAAGQRIAQETRLWNDEKGETAPMRSKESAHDYRYFPEPDLPPLEIPASLVEEIRAELPELPQARAKRFREVYALSSYDVGVLTSTRAIADYFETVAGATGDPKAAANFVMTEVLRVLNEQHLDVRAFPITPTALAELVVAVGAGRINRQAAKKVFSRMFEAREAAAAAIAALGLEQISDSTQLRAVVERVVAANQRAVADYRAGKEKALHSLKGLVMRETRGKANPAVVEQILMECIAER